MMTANMVSAASIVGTMRHHRDDGHHLDGDHRQGKDKRPIGLAAFDCQTFSVQHNRQ